MSTDSKMIGVLNGVWLTDAAGNRLGAVQCAQPDPLHPGCVDIQISSSVLDTVSQGSGDWRVQDERVGTCYCVQALYAAPGPDCVQLRVSTLGEPTQLQEEYDEDYLLVEGQAAVRLSGFLIANGQCSQGLHVRCELSVEDLRSLGLNFSQPARCSCGEASIEPAKCSHSVHRWHFAELERQTTGGTPCLAQIDIIRLKQRQTHHCRFHVGLPENDLGSVVLIGHVISSESWASVPTGGIHVRKPRIKRCVPDQITHKHSVLRGFPCCSRKSDA